MRAGRYDERFSHELWGWELPTHRSGRQAISRRRRSATGFTLLSHEHFRVANNVDEQDMPGLETNIGYYVRWHECLLLAESRSILYWKVAPVETANAAH